MTNGGAPTDPDDTRPGSAATDTCHLRRPSARAAAAPAVRRVERPRAARVPAIVLGAATALLRAAAILGATASRDCRGRRPRCGRRLPREYGGYRAARTSGLAIASMVLGIVWLFWLGSILAVIFGHVALSQIKRSMGTLSGRGMAIAGLASVTWASRSSS